MNILEETKEIYDTFCDRVKFEIYCRTLHIQEAVNNDVEIDFEVSNV